jgi:hypothetical protein
MRICGVVDAPCNRVLAFAKIEGFKQVEHILDLHELHNFKNAPVHADEGETQVQVCLPQSPTELFHRKGPVSPYWAHGFDIVCDVQ